MYLAHDLMPAIHMNVCRLEHCRAVSYKCTHPVPLSITAAGIRNADMTVTGPTQREKSLSETSKMEPLQGDKVKDGRLSTILRMRTRLSTEFANARAYNISRHGA